MLAFPDAEPGGTEQSVHKDPVVAGCTEAGNPAAFEPEDTAEEQRTAGAGTAEEQTGIEPAASGTAEEAELGAAEAVNTGSYPPSALLLPAFRSPRTQSARPDDRTLLPRIAEHDRVVLHFGSAGHG